MDLFSIRESLIINFLNLAGSKNIFYSLLLKAASLQVNVDGMWDSFK